MVSQRHRLYAEDGNGLYAVVFTVGSALAISEPGNFEPSSSLAAIAESQAGRRHALSSTPPKTASPDT